jgi:hypothetical protein
MQWALDSDVGVVCHHVTRDGDRVTAGTRSGRFILLDRGGSELWHYDEESAVSAVGASDHGARLFVAGTWGGLVKAYVEAGLEWVFRDAAGVVSALALTDDGGRIALGTWAGELWLLSGDGSARARWTLPDAVLGIAADPGGTSLAATLADRTIVVVDASGAERWRRQLPAAIARVANWGYEVFVATADGAMRWFDEDGRTRRETTSLEGLHLLSVAADGDTVVSVDRAARLVYWQHEPRWQVTLPALPDALAVAGAGDVAIAIAALPTNEIVAYDRRQRSLAQPLPARVRSLRCAGSGIQASALLDDGRLAFLELHVLKTWLAPPDVQHRLVPAPLTVGQLGAVTVDLVNAGGRNALGIEVSLQGEFIGAPRPEVVPLLAPNQTARIRKAIEPSRPGDVPVRIVVRYRDELGEEKVSDEDVFVRVSKSP